MNIKPIKVEYLFSIKSHTLKALAEHGDDKRIISYFFDDKLVSKREIEPGTLLSDDDYIRGLVEDYCKNATGVFADIFSHHTDQVFLVSKIIDVIIENYGIEVAAHLKVVKDVYEFELRSVKGEDRLNGFFKSESISEGLEKLRMFTYMLEAANSELTRHIDELADDKVEELIRWL